MDQVGSDLGWEEVVIRDDMREKGPRGNMKGGGRGMGRGED